MLEHIQIHVDYIEVEYYRDLGFQAAVAKFIVSDWVDKVDSDIRLSYRLTSLAGRYGNPMPGLTLSPQSGTMNSATG